VVGDARYLRAYREGYKAALVTVAMAFGITPTADAPSSRRRGERTDDEGSAGAAAFAPATMIYG